MAIGALPPLEHSLLPRRKNAGNVEARWSGNYRRVLSGARQTNLATEQQRQDENPDHDQQLSIKKRNLVKELVKQQIREEIRKRREEDKNRAPKTEKEFLEALYTIDLNRTEIRRKHSSHLTEGNHCLRETEPLSEREAAHYARIGNKNQKFASVGSPRHNSMEETRRIGAELARLSGGIVLDVLEDRTVIMFRGKNYQTPEELYPPTLEAVDRRNADSRHHIQRALDSQVYRLGQYISRYHFLKEDREPAQATQPMIVLPGAGNEDREEGLDQGCQVEGENDDKDQARAAAADVIAAQASLERVEKKMASRFARELGRHKTKIGKERRRARKNLFDYKIRSSKKEMFGTLATHILLLFVAIIAINLYLSSLPAWFFVTQVSTRSIAAFLHNLTLHPHVAGTPQGFATAKFVEERFREFGLSTRTVDYEVLVSYPLKRSLSVVYPSNSSLSLALDEETVDGDGDSSGVIPTFFAYSPSGEALAEVVYANYGQKSDFDELKSLGVEVRGSVVIARLGKSFRGDIVFNAQEEGAVAVVLYPDPRDYATNATTEGYYPFSRWLPPSGVQRGFVIQDPGDPLTPGWPSSKLSERLDASNLTRLGVPAIAVLPISARDALPINEALGGPVAPDSWQGGLAVDAYRAGKGPVKLDLRYEICASWESPRRLDVWSQRSKQRNCLPFGDSSHLWTASEKTSEHNRILQLGCREWVEDNLAMLKARAVAYLNVDEAVTGSSFSASATPQLDNLLFEVTKMVKDPDSNGTIFDSWCGKSNDCVGRLGGGGSDYAPFLQHAGIPSTSMTYEEKNSDFPVYHSLYDNYNWMKNFGDPEFHRHATDFEALVPVVKVWGLLARRLAMDTILPFNYVSYANVLEVAVKDLEARFLLISGHPVNILSLSKSRDVNFFPLHSVVDQPRELASKIPSFTAPRNGEGLPGKPWFKHLISNKCLWYLDIPCYCGRYIEDGCG
ncbi:hypothetical protein SELMODRAFT_402884 [Selaginella moellendorffii]|uniref:Uncharacterized protein AMP1D2-1 n=1 Tax=Selaginella moellendorffii TaxID=88036 RepID=D8QNC5_SELML|nr:hypothetical protein SELMODRAFT_402884 [Selaginella moellendorffii]